MVQLFEPRYLIILWRARVMAGCDGVDDTVYVDNLIGRHFSVDSVSGVNPASNMACLGTKSMRLISDAINERVVR